MQAAGKKKFSSAEQKATAAGENTLTFYWDYSFRAPKPEAVGAVAVAVVRFMGEHADPVGESCDGCGAASGGVLHCLFGVLGAIAALSFLKEKVPGRELVLVAPGGVTAPMG